jgi:predicted O-methyltransferase YrrM
MTTMLPRVNALARWVLGDRPAPAAPMSAANTYLEPGNQWYAPVLGGAHSLEPRIVGGHVVRQALAVLDTLDDDVYRTFVRNFYIAGLERYGDDWHYADINTALIGLADALRPATYLEIGVRRGRSLAMVASRAPACRIVAADMFVENYANMDNPGPRFVEQEMARLGFAGQLEFVIGDSSKTLPPYFERHPDLYFDLITVDGDHTASGATADLVNVMPRLKIGGALVFDDISNPSHRELMQVWQDTVAAVPGFSSFTFDEIGFGVGVAVRHA